MKTIKSKTNECKHKVIKRIENVLEGEPNGSTMGSCYYCRQPQIITHKYKEIIDGIYELK